MNKIIKLSIICLLVISAQFSQTTQKRSVTDAQVTDSHNPKISKIDLDTQEILNKALEHADKFYDNFGSVDFKPIGNDKNYIHASNNITIVQTITDQPNSVHPTTVITFNIADQAIQHTMLLCNGKVKKLVRSSFITSSIPERPEFVEITGENKNKFKQCFNEIVYQLDRCGMELRAGSTNGLLHVIYKKHTERN